MATTSIETLRQQAEAAREAAAKSTARAERLEAQAATQEGVLNAEPGTAVTVTRRDSSTQPGKFIGAKETERGILIRVEVGEGFDTEHLTLNPSAVSFDADKE